SAAMRPFPPRNFIASEIPLFAACRSQSLFPLPNRPSSHFAHPEFRNGCFLPEKLALSRIACYSQVHSPYESKEVQMRMPIIALIALAVVFSVSLLSTPAPVQQAIEKDAGLGVLSSNSQKGGEAATGPYQVVPKWPQPFARQGYIQGSQGGVFAETP